MIEDILEDLLIIHGKLLEAKDHHSRDLAVSKEEIVEELNILLEILHEV
jgi:hypothetical protein